MTTNKSHNAIARVRERINRLRAAEFASRAAEHAKLRAWAHQLADFYTVLRLRSAPEFDPACISDVNLNRRSKQISDRR